MQFQEQVWDVRIETKSMIDGESVREVTPRRFKTYEAAIAYTKERIREADISPCLGALRNDEGWEYRNAMADFLEKLVDAGCMLNSKKEIPSLSRKEYAVPDYHGIRVKGNDPAPPLTVKANASGTHLSFLYEYGPYYVIDTDILLPNLFHETSVSLCFRYECQHVSKVPEGEHYLYLVTLQGRLAKSTADNAVQIVELLRQSEAPLTQTQIADKIGIDRRTAGRHINKMVAENAYNIQRAGKRGYYIAQKASGLTYGDIQTISQSIKKDSSIKSEEKERLLELLSKL